MVVRALAIALLAFFNLASAADPQAGCSVLQTQLGQEIVQTNGPEYNAGATHPWNAFNREFRPRCIVFPESTEHVETAMSVIFMFDLDYAVQSGGHSAMTGWNNLNSGVLILFTNMKDVSYDPIRDTVTLQPGSTWGEVISALEPLGVAVMGGRVSDVGTGLLPGGGISFLAPAHGFSADAYVELDVVLVTGELVTATATNEFSDLFRALKGGANRFGIVTRYELSAIHTGTAENESWFGGMLSFPITSADEVLQSLAHYVRDVTDPRASILCYFANIATNGTLTGLILANVFYNGTELPQEVYGELLNVTGVDKSMLGPISYFGVSNFLDDSTLPIQGQLFGGSAVGSDEQSYIDVFNHFMNFTSTFSTSIASTNLAFTPVLNPQILAGRARGGNAIDPPLGGYNAIQFQVSFPVGTTEVPPALEAGRQLFFQQVPPAPGLPIYINECDAKQNVFETYGQYQFLKNTYAKYDPTRFNVRHTKGPMGL
ncbi:FAD-binding domain-containing protein [Mycena floridula]|nr:FAD-binding domain-containing protein [Mycena floridula]